MTWMPEPRTFETYFHDRANLAESLYRDGWRHEAVLIASVALDALANIWEHDKNLNHVNSAVRLANFVQSYTGDADAMKIAVVFLAQDMLAHGPPRLHAIAKRLLAKRNVDLSGQRPRPMTSGTSPYVHLDADWLGVTVEEPALANEPAMERLATERYTYPALLYTLTRCAVAHSLSRGTRTSDFSGKEPDEEISYFPPHVGGNATRPISLKIGLKRITNWVRTTATGYARECEQLGAEPANAFDPSGHSLCRLYGAWRTVT